MTPHEVQKVPDELEASRSSRKRAWENLQELRWVLQDSAGMKLPPPAKKTQALCAKDGGTLEYVFDGGAQNSPNAVTKEKAAEIAADFMTTFITYRSEHWRLRSFGQCRFHSG